MEIAEEQSLRQTGTVVEVDHPKRDKYLKYLTEGNPIKLSDSPAEVRRSPLRGEPTEELLRTVLGFEDKEITTTRPQGAIGGGDSNREIQLAHSGGLLRL